MINADYSCMKIYPDVVGDYDIEAQGEFPSSFPYRTLMEIDEVSVTQYYRDTEGIHREKHEDMSGEEASEWLQEFDIEDMLSSEALQSGAEILGWNPFRPDGFEDGFDRYELRQKDGRGSLDVMVRDRSPWPILQEEKVRFEWNKS